MLEIVSGGSCGLFKRNDTFIEAHFFGLNFMLFVAAHSSKLSKCSCITDGCEADMGSTSVKSSTYFNVTNGVSTAASLAIIKKPSGPSLVP